ncbi:TraB/GumN family protein [Massilia endophytica]|uniref:TraB/GumN family protein n=1 Tax=Massilia endophytica TaxID=2899220 RepID=UPI001E41D2BF|nr:TraB/GumN family protein [Massilia endophytica]UGQ46316.1 TraB/GumN family protein [Massilia endophytica]
MQRLIIVIFSSLFWFAGVPAWADAGAVQNRGALFKAEQGGHVVWLFGTIHVGAPDFYPLEPRMMQALDEASVLALEVDPLGDKGALVQAVRQHGMYQNGRGPAFSELPKAYQPRLERQLQRFAISREAVMPMKPWMIASLLAVSEFAAQGYQPELAVDAWLSREARARKVRVVELESAAGQMALFGAMPNKEQLLFLQDSIDAIDNKEQAEEARALGEAWRKADIAAFDGVAAKLDADTSFSARFVKRVLLAGRNPALADNIAKQLANEKRSIAAIGVLHLVGKESVPELLRRKGIAVERVY